MAIRQVKLLWRRVVKAELEKLVAYYKSIGATVETIGNGYYKVAFDYAQSVRVSATSGAVEVQFSVVKK